MKNFLNAFKEQLLIVPFTIVLFFGVNWLLSWLSPSSSVALFDPFSMLDTIMGKFTFAVFMLSAGWIIYWFTFPQMYKFFMEYVYHGWDNLSEELKLKLSVIFLITILLCLSLMSRGAENTELRNKVVVSLNSQLNVRETGSNRGKEVDRYLISVGAPVGVAWCGAFVGWNLSQYKIKNPNSAWSPNYALKQDVIWTYTQPKILPLPGDVITLYFSNLGRVGHTGFYEKTDKDGYFITIEGNTNGAGSREGDGVYRKKRGPWQIHAITRYIK